MGYTENVWEELAFTRSFNKSSYAPRERWLEVRYTVSFIDAEHEYLNLFICTGARYKVVRKNGLSKHRNPVQTAGTYQNVSWFAIYCSYDYLK